FVFKTFDQHFTALVSSPFSETENAVLRNASPGEIRVLRAGGKNSVGAKVNVLAAIFINQRAAISRQQDRDGVGHENQARGHIAGHFESGLIAYSHIVQINVVHQVMNRYVGVLAGHASNGGQGQGGKNPKKHLSSGPGGKKHTEYEHPPPPL